MKIDFPLAIKVSENEKDKVAFYDSLRGLMTSDVIVLTGSNYSYNFGLELIDILNFEPAYSFKIDDNSLPDLIDIVDSQQTQQEI